MPYFESKSLNNFLQNGQTALSHRRLWAAVRGGVGVLGPRLQPGGALLLDDIHTGE